MEQVKQIVEQYLEGMITAEEAMGRIALIVAGGQHGM
jgi:hypothetical protein